MHASILTKEWPLIESLTLFMCYFLFDFESQGGVTLRRKSDLNWLPNLFSAVPSFLRIHYYYSYYYFFFLPFLIWALASKLLSGMAFPNRRAVSLVASALKRLSVSWLRFWIDSLLAQRRKSDMRSDFKSCVFCSACSERLYICTNPLRGLFNYARLFICDSVPRLAFCLERSAAAMHCCRCVWACF